MKNKSLMLGFILLLAGCLLTTCTSNKSKNEQAADPYIQKMNANNGKVFTENTSGNRPLENSPYGGEMWTQAGNNNRLIWYGPDYGGGAAFRAEWTYPNIFLARIGYFWNEGKPYTAYGDVFCDFEFTRSEIGTGGGASYLGIYGWSRDPLIEWYIVDDCFALDMMTPARIGGGAAKKGEFTIDGAVYFIYQATRLNQPSIDGTATFPQYFSIRQDRRQSGTISITEHFKEWEKLGMELGTNMYEAKFLVEAGSGNGWFDASYISFYQK